GGAVGYVLGTRAGREQFEKIRSSAKNLWEDPRVQETVSDVEHRASDFVKGKAPELKEKVSGAVRSASDAVRPGKDEDRSSWESSETSRPNGTSTTPWRSRAAAGR